MTTDPLLLGIIALGGFLLFARFFRKPDGQPGGVDAIRSAIADQLRTMDATSSKVSAEVPDAPKTREAFRSAPKKPAMHDLESLAEFLRRVPRDKRDAIINEYVADMFKQDFGLSDPVESMDE